MAGKIIGTLVVIGVLAAVVLSTIDHVNATCEVCMVYRGRQVCEEASAGDRQQAIFQATNAACVQLSSGVTDGIECGNTPPRSTSCRD